MKKLVAILVAVLFVVSVTGLCFAADKAAAPAKADEKAAVKADDKAVKADDKAAAKDEKKVEKKAKKAKKAKKEEAKKEEAAPAPAEKK